MRVEKIKCASFRNLNNTELLPCDSMNVICGENAQGKTNIIEAVWLFTGAKSFRPAKDSSFIRFGEQKAKNEISFFQGETRCVAVMEFGEKRTAFFNEKALSNPSKLAGSFNAIVFSPNDLSLVRDGPAVRRKFLDTAIGQLYPGYIEILKSYIRAVTQRNQCIRDYKYDSSLSIMLDVFEKEIVSFGLKIIKFRRKYIERLNEYLPKIYDELSGGREKIEAIYECICLPEELEKSIKDARKNDMHTGSTSVGPHRDELELTINGVSARGYGSQGQMRSVALSLKLSQSQVIREISGEHPVCLLDDVMSELDPSRQNYIFNHIKDCQSFITCCEPDSVARLREGKIFKIRNGEIF